MTLTVDQLIQIAGALLVGAGAIIVACFRFVDARTQMAEAKANERISALETRVQALEEGQGAAKTHIRAARDIAILEKRPEIIEHLTQAEELLG